MSKPTVATVWFEGCSGCHMSLLDLDERLVEVLAGLQLTFSPVTDFKDFDFPKTDVGIIEGGIGNVEHKEIALRLRQKSKILVALGDCAVFGGINTLRNGLSKEDVLRRGFIETESTVSGVIPRHEDLPALLDRVLAVNAVVPVDVYVPGCPPAAEVIAYALNAILQGRTPVLPADMIHFD